MRFINKKTMVLFLSFVFGLCASAAFAEEVDVAAPTGMYIDIKEPIAIDQPKQLRKARASTSSSLSFEDYIVSEMLQQKSQINIYDYQIPTGEVGEKVIKILMEHPELMAETSVQILHYRTDPTYGARVDVSYLTSSLAESNEKRALLQSEIDRYISSAASCADPLGKLLIAHDKLASECVYDNDVTSEFDAPAGAVIYTDSSGNCFFYEDNDEDKTKHYCYQKDGEWKYSVINHPQSYHLLGLIEDKTAVCQGFSQMTYMIAKQLGFEVNYIYSEQQLNHIWNCIKIDGKWYHIDTTWDDTWRGTSNAEVSHDFFLRSDADFKKQREDNNNGSHYATDWETYLDEMPVCDSTLYEKDHIFNFLGRGITSYTEGKYRLQTTYIQNTPMTFVSDSLRSGSLLVTEATESGTDFDFWICATSDISGLTAFSTVKNGENFGKFTFEKQNFSLSAQNSVHFSRKKSAYVTAAGEQASFMFWDMSAMTPYSNKITIK